MLSKNKGSNFKDSRTFHRRIKTKIPDKPAGIERTHDISWQIIFKEISVVQ